VPCHWYVTKININNSIGIIVEKNSLYVSQIFGKWIVIVTFKIDWNNGKGKKWSWFGVFKLLVLYIIYPCAFINWLRVYRFKNSGGKINKMFVLKV